MSRPKTSNASCGGATKLIGGRENVFNHDLARALVQIAREWVKVDAGVLAELTRLAGKVPMPVSGLTAKNKRALRQFDDPAVLQRLYNFPSRLWAEVKRDAKPNVLTLVKAQAALAVAILCYMPCGCKILRRLPSTCICSCTKDRARPRAWNCPQAR